MVHKGSGDYMTEHWSTLHRLEFARMFSAAPVTAPASLCTCRRSLFWGAGLILRPTRRHKVTWEGCRGAWHRP